jgi:carbon storage regulator
MLVLTRKPGEKVVIGGGVTLTVLSCEAGRIRLGFTAPAEVRILRGELLDREVNVDQRAPEAIELVEAS